MPPKPRAVGECADLDANQVLDCRETLIANPDFKKDTAGWRAEDKVTLSFAAEDAEKTVGSGSLVVTNANTAALDGQTMAGAQQCLPATGADRYDVAAQVRVPDGQESANASVRIAFYTDAGCTGIVAGFFATDPVTERAAWKAVEGVATAPRGARSMLVRLLVNKPFRQPSAIGHFDNVLVRAR